jgi:hypothetical protein
MYIYDLCFDYSFLSQQSYKKKNMLCLAYDHSLLLVFSTTGKKRKTSFLKNVHISKSIPQLPLEMQSKVATYMKLDTNSHSDSEGSTSGVGIATSKSYCVLPASESPPGCPFPPTAMVYSMRGLGKC